MSSGSAVMATAACLFFLTGAWSLVQLVIDFTISTTWYGHGPLARVGACAAHGI